MTDMMNEWSKQSIRSLRLRLGWSQADLARRLSCACTDVDAWESGDILPNPLIANELIMIAKQAEACSEEIHASPLVETLCEKRALGQIDFSEFEEEIE
ncbi:MAG: XRE family transcriptional regulator [Bdellovibrionaceae bacterium]|nr:XRE family transcriptional regulator [Pseudobdellovibrionaceae bacterium]